jgi:DNA ligase-associated metallophosphoesterase
MKLKLHEIQFKLLPDKALFREDTHTLIIADLHLGKAMHFRKSGIPIPPQSAELDYLRLHKMIHAVQPKRIIFLGDLFHSVHNSEWNLFCDFINAYKEIEFILVIGNHDILARHHYKKICITLIEDQIEEEGLILSHIPLENIPENTINIAGHVHPAVVLKGKGKQHIKLPCFYFFNDQLILPAFGSLTGLQLIEPQKNSEVFVIADNKVIKV